MITHNAKSLFVFNICCADHYAELQTRDLHIYHLLSAALDSKEQQMMDGFLQLGAERRQRVSTHPLLRKHLHKVLS